MKATIRIPTVQFGYIEIEVPVEVNGNLVNVGNVVGLHNNLVAEYEKTKAEVQKLKDDNF